MKKLTLFAAAASLIAVALTVQAFSPNAPVRNSTVACGGCTNSAVMACGNCTNSISLACGDCTNTLLLACGGGCTNSLTL